MNALQLILINKEFEFYHWSCVLLDLEYQTKLKGQVRDRFPKYLPLQQFSYADLNSLNIHFHHLRPPHIRRMLNQTRKPPSLNALQTLNFAHVIKNKR